MKNNEDNEYNYMTDEKELLYNTFRNKYIAPQSCKNQSGNKVYWMILLNRNYQFLKQK